MCSIADYISSLAVLQRFTSDLVALSLDNEQIYRITGRMKRNEIFITTEEIHRRMSLPLTEGEENILPKRAKDFCIFVARSFVSIGDMGRAESYLRLVQSGLCKIGKTEYLTDKVIAEHLRDMESLSGKDAIIDLVI